MLKTDDSLKMNPADVVAADGSITIDMRSSGPTVSREEIQRRIDAVVQQMESEKASMGVSGWACSSNNNGGGSSSRSSRQNHAACV